MDKHNPLLGRHHYGLDGYIQRAGEDKGMGKTGKVVSKPAYRRMQTADSWRNLMLRAGIGAGSADDGGHYAVNYTSRDRAQLDAAYRSNWMAMKWSACRQST